MCIYIYFICSTVSSGSKIKEGEMIIFFFLSKFANHVFTISVQAGGCILNREWDYWNKKGKKQGQLWKPWLLSASWPSSLGHWPESMSSAVEVKCWSICRYRWFLWWCLEDKEQPARARKEQHEYAACGAVFLQDPAQRGMILEIFVFGAEELMGPQVQNCYLMSFGLKIFCSLFISHLFRGRKNQLHPQALGHTVTICCSIPHCSCQFWHCETPWKQLSY